jgi:hypothetical protein
VEYLSVAKEPFAKFIVGTKEWSFAVISFGRFLPFSPGIDFFAEGVGRLSFAFGGFRALIHFGGLRNNASMLGGFSREIIG